MDESTIESFFQVGDRVRYVPKHANGDLSHKDCENGIISSFNDWYVFVLYEGDIHSKATYYEDIIKCE